jgi:hypothetical protein
MALLSKRWIFADNLAKSARVLAAVVALTCTVGAQAASQPPSLSEYDIKAVFLLNFARFIEWPATEGAGSGPIVIGVLGSDPFGHLLDNVVKGEKVNNRPVVVKRITNPEDAVGCAALFISRSERPRIAQILQRLTGHAILTVSDIPEFAEAGGMVGLVSDKGKIRLQINVDVAKAAKLEISSKLLRPAQIVSTRKTSRFGLPRHAAEPAQVTRR